METPILVTFDHSKDSFQKSIFVNGKSLNDIFMDFSPDEADKIQDDVESLIKGISERTDNAIITQVVDLYQGAGLERFIVATVFAGMTVYELSMKARMYIMNAVMTSEMKTTSEFAEKLMNETFERTLEEHSEKTNNFMFAMKMFITGMIASFLTEHDHNNTSDGEDCSKCSVANCPVRREEYKLPLDSKKN